MSGKTGILTLVGLIAVILALIGSNFTVIAGLSLTWVVMAWILLELMGITSSIPILKQLSGKSNPTTITYIFVALLLINFGVIGAVFSGAGTSGSGSAGITLPHASVATTPTQGTTGSGQSYVGQLDFIPVDAFGGVYAASGRVAFTDGTPGRYDVLKLISDTGESAVKFQGVSSKFMTQASNKFSETQLSGKVGDTFTVFGYLDATPAKAENESFSKKITLTGFNPQSGSNGGIWSWKFDDGGIRYQWPNYATTYFYDSTETNRITYTDYQAVSLTGRSVTVYVYPNSTGEAIVDAGLYIESSSGNASNIKKVIITGPSGKSVSYTALQNSALLGTDNPISVAAPALVTSTNTQYWVGKFPESDYIRTSSSNKGKYSIEIQYDAPANGQWQWYLQGVQNMGALTATGGHFDFNQPSGFQMNVTSIGATSGFSS